MTLAPLIFLVIGAIILHEFGHILTMHRAGIRFKEIGIGYKIPFIPSLSFKIKWLKNITLKINHLPLGAYIKTFPEDDKKFEEFSYAKQSVILGAGVLANFLYGGILLIIIPLLSKEPLIKIISDFRFMATAGALIALALGYKFFCKYMLLILGVAAAGLMALVLIMEPNATFGNFFAMIPATKIALSNLQTAFLAAAGISFLLGISNSIPLCPLDGGQLVYFLLGRLENQKIRKRYKLASLIIFVALLALGCIYVCHVFASL
ncbi:M50 family metallopeptidase [Patescibacteria group bacterium]|nr:M50 family metallopeptidase [Patescibacteria group bacterium]